MGSDRLKDAARGLQRLDPLIPYRYLYRARVISQRKHCQVDVRPLDQSLPDMAGIPLMHGIPGLTVSLCPGALVHVGWQDGRPDRPFAALFGHPSAEGAANADGGLGYVGAVQKLTFGSATVQLGEGVATEAVPLGTSQWAAIEQMLTAAAAACTAAATACAVPGVPFSPLGVPFSSLARAFQNLNTSGLGGAFLSQVSKTR